MIEEVEHPFSCPYCWAPITMLLDTSVDSQRYTEDCEVCCRPIDVHVTAADGDLQSFEARSMS